MLLTLQYRYCPSSVLITDAQLLFTSPLSATYIRLPLGMTATHRGANHSSAKLLASATVTTGHTKAGMQTAHHKMVTCGFSDTSNRLPEP
jgi:hypothetical protein